ncbi:helix-turn-helix domain-containing protein [Dermacoccus sp. CCH2-D9]
MQQSRMSISEIARLHGMSRDTVRRALSGSRPTP